MNVVCLTRPSTHLHIFHWQDAEGEGEGEGEASVALALAAAPPDNVVTPSFNVTELGAVIGDAAATAAATAAAKAVEGAMAKLEITYPFIGLFPATGSAAARSGGDGDSGAASGPPQLNVITTATGDPDFAAAGTYPVQYDEVDRLQIVPVPGDTTY